jgi:hypothetical protein
MARNADRLAGLAALAGAAYLYNKGKTKDTGTTDSNPTRAARPESTETREEPRRQITDYIKQAPQDPKESVAESPSASSDVFAAKTTPVKPRSTVTGSDLSARPTPTPAPTVGGNEDYGNEGYRSQSPQLKAINAANGADSRSANRGDELANVSRAVKREARTRQFAQDVPYQESAAKTDAMMVASRAARAADAKRRAAKQNSYKSGGMVSKASSASKRADGIASKGKTRGKIC